MSPALGSSESNGLTGSGASRLSSSVVSYSRCKRLFLKSFLITLAGDIAVFSDAVLDSYKNQAQKSPAVTGEAWLCLLRYATNGIRR